MRNVVIAAVLLSLLIGSPIDAQEAKPDEALTEALKHRDAGNFDRAMEALKDLLDARPDDSTILVELARTAWYQAQEILSSEAFLGGLALIDAKNWAQRAAKANPRDVEAWRLYGATAASSSAFEEGAEAYRRAIELAPKDGELHYGLGYCHAWNRQFAEALEAFKAAGKILGDDPKVLLNTGICHASLGNPGKAAPEFTKLIDVELEAGRGNSEWIRSGWVWLWRIHREKGDFRGAAKVFAELAGRHPKVSATWWYLGHALRESGDRGRAAGAFEKVVEISPAYAEGWRLLGGELAKASKFPKARAAYQRLNELTPGAEGARDLLLDLARAMERKDKRAEALALLAAEEASFEGDPSIPDLMADMQFRLGHFEKALAGYRRCVELDSWSRAYPLKAEKVVTALLRAGSGSHRREPGEEAPPLEGGSIFDFEKPGIYFRTKGSRGERRDGSFVLKAGVNLKPPARVAYLTMIPTLDTTPYKTLRFAAKGREGGMLVLEAKDCYDEFGMQGVNIRLAVRPPLVLTGDWETFEVPLDSFKPRNERRPIPMNRARLRMLIFAPRTGGDLLLDDIYLVAEDETEFLLEDFDLDPRETTFVSEGAATPFARTLFTPDQIPGFRPDPNTFVTPAIFGEEYDPAMVHDGRGSYRLVLRQTGQPASGVLAFNPDRSYDDATAITFRARGQKGGEKLRVTLRDALDDDMGNKSPASAPRGIADGGLEEGHYVLGKDWQRFRVPRHLFPDVNFDALAEIRFHMGGPEGNDVGATIYLDDIGWDRKSAGSHLRGGLRRSVRGHSRM